MAFQQTAATSLAESQCHSLRLVDARAEPAAFPLKAFPSAADSQLPMVVDSLSLLATVAVDLEPVARVKLPTYQATLGQVTQPILTTEP